MSDKIVELVNDIPLVSHRVIAEQTNNKEVSVRNLINKYRDKFESLGNLHFKNEGLKRKTKDGKSRGEVQNVTYFLDEPQSTFLMTLLRNSEKVVDFKLRLTKEFFKMREIIETSSENANLESNLSALKFTFETLAISSDDRIKMMRKLYKKLNLETVYLPEYVDGDASFSLTHLLKENGIKMSARKVNALLEEKGFIEKKFRASSKKRVVVDEDGNEKEEAVQKFFWSITKSGLEFGRNVISTHGLSTETQVRFYEKKFPELLEKISL